MINLVRTALALILAVATFALARDVRAVPPSGEYPSPDWRPNLGKPESSDFVGARVCAECHPAQAQAELRTSMGRAAELIEACDILRKHPNLQAQVGAYHYLINRRGDKATYTVSNGTREISAPILWAFGQGEAGQTYILKWDKGLYQSRVSFFNDVQGLDLTLGAPRSTPTTLEEALGAPITSTEARLCFGCHTTAGLINGAVSANDRTSGVACEACHAPGAKHVQAMRAGKLDEDFIFNPAKLGTGDLADFCGACHRTWLQVELAHMQGIETVRFQPYRLEKSRCWNQEDDRISCLACHDPHTQIIRDTASYDEKCLACHASNAGSSPRAVRAKTCPVKSRACVSCHMPKYKLPGGHFKFTDHNIRVVRPGEPFVD